MNNTVAISVELPDQRRVDVQVNPHIPLSQLVDQLVAIYQLPPRPYAVQVATQQRWLRGDHTLQDAQITAGDALRLREDEHASN